MRAPRKAQINQSVEIRPKESVANTLEVNFTLMEVTKLMTLKESMNQAVTKVNDVGPVIILVAKVDVSHKYGRQHYLSRKWQERGNFAGVLGDGMIQDGLLVNLGDLYVSATRVERRYANTSRKGQVLANEHAEVGLDDSTLSGIRTRTWESVQQVDASFSTSSLNPQRLSNENA